MDKTDSRGKAPFVAMPILWKRLNRSGARAGRRYRSGTCIRHFFEPDDDRCVQAAGLFSSRSCSSGRLIAKIGIVSARRKWRG